MNAARVAALLRELADELERVEEPAPAPRRKPQARRPRPAPVEVSDMARERARRMLRRAGVVPME